MNEDFQRFHSQPSGVTFIRRKRWANLRTGASCNVRVICLDVFFLCLPYPRSSTLSVYTEFLRPLWICSNFPFIQIWPYLLGDKFVAVSVFNVSLSFFSNLGLKMFVWRGFEHPLELTSSAKRPINLQLSKGKSTLLIITDGRPGQSTQQYSHDAHDL